MAIDFILPPISLSSIDESFLSERKIQLDLLRLDQIHPQISGNKWFKLKYNLESAKKNGKDTLLSFGGAYSNHLHALAFAGFRYGMNTIGIVRGDEVRNSTLKDCMQWGMKLHFISREEYRSRYEEKFLKNYADLFPHAYILPEGGKNEEGIRGCAEILDHLPTNHYDVVALSIGSGATARGVLRSMKDDQKLFCYSSFRTNHELIEELGKENHSSFEIRSVFCYGVFGKITKEVIPFKESFFAAQNIALDSIYNTKMMMGLYRDIREGMLKDGSRVLAIHTGGLQGDRV